VNHTRIVLLALLALLTISLLLNNPPLFLLAGLLALVAASTALWHRYCLSGVTYTRRFGAERLFCGETTDLWVEVTNAKPLPLAWLRAEDEFPEHVALAQATVGPSSKPNRRTLSLLFSPRWYERVRRRYRLTAQRRGLYEFGPALLASGDVFGFRTRYLDVDERQTLVVYPKLVPLEQLGLEAARPGGDHLARQPVAPDPLRVAGARDYRPGDSIRHLHWKATARRGQLQTRRFDPGAAQQAYLCLNSQTLERVYEGVDSERFETAVVVAASVAQAWLEARHPVGLFVNSNVQGGRHRVRLPASRHADQLTRILEALAGVTFFPMLPFERMLRHEAAQLPFGAAVLAVSALVNEPILSALLDLQSAGHPVALIAVGRPETFAPPPDLRVYWVTQKWDELESVAFP